MVKIGWGHSCLSKTSHGLFTWSKGSGSSLGSLLSLIKLQNGKFCSGSADTSIKIWDTVKKECVQTLKGHEKWVKCVFELDNGIIVSGSDDNSIKLWKPNEDDKYELLYMPLWEIKIPKEIHK